MFLAAASTSSPDPQFLTNLLLALGFLMSLALSLVNVWKALKNDPQKREVSFKEQYASKEELRRVEVAMKEQNERIDHQFDVLRSEMREDFAETAKASENRTIALHNRINEVLTKVSEVSGKISTISNPRLGV